MSLQIVNQLHRMLSETEVTLAEVENCVSLLSERCLETDFAGDLPLHVACTFGVSLDVIRFLVEKYPPSVRIPNISHRLPLHCACKNPETSPEVVDYLIERYPQALSAADFSKRLPLHYACIVCAPLAVVRRLVQACPQSCRQTDEERLLPLHQACDKRHNDPATCLEIVRLLVNAYPDSVKIATERGSLLPLHIACTQEASFVGLVEYLAEQYLQGLETPDGRGFLPLQAACQDLASRNVVEALVRAFPRALYESGGGRNNNGFLPLHLACGNSRALLDVVQFLVARGPDTLAMRCGEDHLLPLHVALRRNAPLAVIACLVRAYPEGAVVPAGRQMPLLWAMGHRDAASAVEVLVDANPACTKGDALHRLARLYSPRVDLFRLLVARNLDGFSRRDDTGRLPLHYACFWEEREASSAVVELLAEHYPAGLGIADARGRLPLHCAISSRRTSLPVVRVLVERYPQALSRRDANGALPLHRACALGSDRDVVRVLLEGRHDAIRAPDKFGMIPLFVACQRDVDDDDASSLDVILMLLQRSPEFFAEKR